VLRIKKGKFLRWLEDLHYITSYLLYFLAGPKYAEKPKHPALEDHEYY